MIPNVYVDPLMNCLMSRNWRYPQSCHMFVDKWTDLNVLHEFAESIGLRRCWFQNKRGSMPHYDLNARRRAAAVNSGAVELDRRDAVNIIREWRAVTTCQ